MKLWMLLLLTTHHTLHCSEHSPDEATPTPHPLGATVCPTGFLEVLSYSLEGEVPSEAVNDEEDDLPSFADFKQKMSNQGVEVQEVRPSSGLPVTRNYASIECGAKVIETNANAKNPSAILNSNKDEYLINDCSSPIHFVVELCELIYVRTIVVASLELFSSIPKSFRVFATTERYNSEEDSDWSYIGTFLAANERGEQSFPLSNENPAYAKYIKVVMDSHHGQERLCPINTFKVLGASMIEVYEASQQEVGVASQPSIIEGTDEGDVLGLTRDDASSGYNGTLLSAAKDAVLRMLEQPMEFLGTVIKPDGKSTNDDHDNRATVHDTPSTPSNQDSLSSSDINTQLTEDVEAQPPDKLERESVADTSPDKPADVNKNIERDISSIADTMEDNSASPPPEGDKGQLETSSDTHPATHKEAIKEETTSSATTDECTIIEELSTIYENNNIQNEQLNEATHELLGPAVLGESPTDPLGPIDELSGKSPNDEPIGPTTTPVTPAGEVPSLEGEPPHSAPSTEPLETTLDSIVPSLTSEPSDADQRTPVDSTTHDTTLTLESSNISNSSSPLLNNSNSTLKGLNDSIANTSNHSDGGSKNRKNESSETVVLTNGQAAPRDKEKSVFLRLSNQIRELEMNMSLFSSYLDQISSGLKRNKNKTEEATKSLDRRMTSLNETLQLLMNETEVKGNALQDLSSHLQALTEAVVSMTMEMTAVDDKILISLFLLVGIQSLVFIALLVVCCLVQASNQRSLQRELQSLRITTVQMLSQQSTHSSQNGRTSPLILLNQQTQNCTSRVDDELTTSVSLPSLHELTPPPHDNDGEWTVADGRHRKKIKLRNR